MKIVVDLDTLPVDGKGEVLRGLVFNQKVRGENLLRGCYSTFELNPGFEKIDPQKYPNLFEMIAPSPETRDGITISAYESKKLVAMWWWNGDGTLLIWVKGALYAYVNYDCKKDYTWEDMPI